MTPSELDAIEARAKAARTIEVRHEVGRDAERLARVGEIASDLIRGRMVAFIRAEAEKIATIAESEACRDGESGGLAYIARLTFAPANDVPALVEEVRWMRHGAASAAALINEMRQGHPATCLCRACAASAYLNQMAEGKP